MADIHILPVRTDKNVDHITTLLEAALAQRVNLGPRGPHIKAIALTLEQQVEGLRQIMTRSVTVLSERWSAWTSLRINCRA